MAAQGLPVSSHAPFRVVSGVASCDYFNISDPQRYAGTFLQCKLTTLSRNYLGINGKSNIFQHDSFLLTERDICLEDKN